MPGAGSLSKARTSAHSRLPGQASPRAGRRQPGDLLGIRESAGADLVDPEPLKPTPAEPFRARHKRVGGDFWLSGLRMKMGPTRLDLKPDAGPALWYDEVQNRSWKRTRIAKGLLD